MHYHAIGDAEDMPNKRMHIPNSACRCEDHIAAPLKGTRQRPTCALECYMCERMRVLEARLAVQ